MYGRQLRRSLALATGAVVAGEAAARVFYYEGKERHQHQQHQPPQSALLALLRARLAEARGAEPFPIPLLLEPAASADRPTRERSTAAYFLGGRPPAGCDAKKGKGSKLDEYHAVPLPATDSVHTAEVVARLKPYVAARDLETVRGCIFDGGVWDVWIERIGSAKQSSCRFSFSIIDTHSTNHHMPRD